MMLSVIKGVSAWSEGLREPVQPAILCQFTVEVTAWLTPSPPKPGAVCHGPLQKLHFLTEPAEKP